MNHLEKILTGQLSRLENLKSIYPIEFLKEKIKSYNNFIDFREKLKVEKNKVSVLSLTDHDTFDGIPEFLQFAETTENWLFPEAPRLRFPRNQEFLSNALIKISRTCIPR